jgi:PAS domain S-box-containing protein/putative nucleotidyltransferase with HDIG domain
LITVDVPGRRDASVAKGKFSPDEFRAAAEFIPHMVWMATPDRLVEYVNSQGTDYVGLPMEDICGWKWISVLHPDDADRVRTVRDLAARTQAPLGAECRLRRFDGQYRWHDLRSLPVLDDDGAILKWIGTATDIEDVKRAEADLRLSKYEVEEALTLLETLQGNVPIGFCLVYSDFRYLRINEALAAYNGLPVAEHIGRRTAEVVPELWPEIEPYYRRVLETGESVLNVEVERPSLADPGQMHSWLESFYPAIVDGESIGVGAIVVDVTQSKQAERTRSDLTQAAADAMAAMVEVRDPYTSGHQSRVAAIASAIAVDLGLDDDTVEGIDLAARIHDIGKIGTPAEILSRPSNLSPMEWELIKIHAQAGADIVKGISFPWPVAEMIVQHHERLDGSGYPGGLRGEEICLGARIIAVADTVEAMSSHRPYRAALGIDAALDEIVNGRGKLFDPAVVDACVALVHSGRMHLETTWESTG